MTQTVQCVIAKPRPCHWVEQLKNGDTTLWWCPTCGATVLDRQVDGKVVEIARNIPTLVHHLPDAD